LRKYRFNCFKFPFFLICFLFFPNQTKSNSIDNIIAFGDSLFNNGNYIPALQEYKRANFFADSSYKPGTVSRIANTYFFLEDYKNARIYYDSSSYYSDDESIKTDYFFQKIVCYMLEGDFSTALLRLEQKPNITSEFDIKKKNLYTGVCYFGFEQYDSAYLCFKKSISKKDTSKLIKLEEQFEECKKLNRPHESIAIILSIILPGAGQIYAGDVKNSLNSLLLVSGLLYAGVLAPSMSYYLTLPFFYRYYMGGLSHARQIAIDKKLSKKQEFYLNLDIFDQADSDSVYLKKLFSISDHKANYSKYLKESDTELKLLLTFSFLFYKEFISSQDVNACVFEPSCSIYMMEAVEKNGTFIGFFDGIDRLLRCHFLVSRKDYLFNSKAEKYYDPL
jgi:putative component of membrane protein insertase Oxa1/YidC/SpoIIIJ protein YidD